MFGKKGQGTTEYLIILAIIIVIALVVVGVMGWFPGLSAGITESQSKAYWQSTSPVGILEYSISGADANFILRNTSTKKVTVTSITLDGTDLGVPSTAIAAGADQNTSGTPPSCISGDSYNYDVVITYNTTGGLSGAKVTGNKPLVGTCS